ncbi:MAG TPA: Crp/Fnr family transcriptional regulator [Bdellovibrio sp.]|uniref:Crp/Fnr family transcriptional regulator n=1 Tax=Bdellovibrio sp. TaxID=28201 RepID=UPI002EFCE43C
MHPTELKLSSLPAFETCPLEALLELQEKSDFVTYKPRAVIAEKKHAADFVFVILFGTIKLQQKLNPAETVIYHFLSRGDIFGASIENSSSGTYLSDAVAVDHCGLLKIPTLDFHKTLHRHNSIMKALWTQMSMHLSDLQLDHAFQKKTVPHRIAEFLLRMHQRQAPIYGNKIKIPLSRRDIAAKIGSKPETVARVLSDWTRKGWIHTQDKFLELLDLESLRAVR